MFRASVLQAERPRNVNAFQAAALLYGDWGTSKIYVIGLAYAMAGSSSFWLILAVSLLNILVGINYISICKCYPNGGGVYASVRNRSQVLAFVGGFLLVADYIVTASLSALSAFEYLGVMNPAYWAIGTILLIGLLNSFGPRHTGNLALLITLVTIAVVLVLASLSISYLPIAIHNVTPLEASLRKDWTEFVSVIVALSGIEAIANTTGVMKLDPGSTSAKPSVIKTATPAIIAVMLEVSIFTALFGLAVNALPGLTIIGDTVSAPGYPNVRDSMLRYMGEVFTTGLLGVSGAKIFGFIISIAFGILLLSAVNTAISALTSLLFVMSLDSQLPKAFQKINQFGVPKLPLLIAGFLPAFLLLYVDNMIALANLYAVGFVGAIATNLGSTSTDSRSPLNTYERHLMLVTFFILAAVEITLFIEKPDARAFVITVMALGLLLRALVIERRELKIRPPKPLQKIITELRPVVVAPETETKRRIVAAKRLPTGYESHEDLHMHPGPSLCASTHVGKSLEFSIQNCICAKQHLYVLFIREQRVFTMRNLGLQWTDDQQATEIVDHLLKFLTPTQFTFIYDVSNSPALDIIEYSKSLKVSTVILGMSRISKIVQVIRGDIVKEVQSGLPINIDLIVIS